MKVLAALMAKRVLVVPQAPASSLILRVPVPEIPIPEIVTRESASPSFTPKLAIPFRTTPPERTRLLAVSPRAKRAMLPALRFTGPDWVSV